MKKAAIIVVTYNAEKYIKPLFLSLENLNYPEFKVFVVDNGSRDGTVEEIKKFRPSTLSTNSSRGSLGFIENRGTEGFDPPFNFPPYQGGDKHKLAIELIKNRENLGFAGGNNVGMRRGLEQGYEYIVLLNQDMEVEEDWLSELVQVAESDERIGIVQAMMMLMSDRNKIYTTGDRLNYIGIGYSGNFQFSIFRFQLRKNIITYAGGAAVLFKSGLLKEIGLLDELFFMYHEDSDLSWRARMVGYDIVLARNAVCYHDYSFKRNNKVFYWTEKNRLALLAKNFEVKTLILIAPMYVVMDIGMMGYALLTGWLPEKIKAYGWFLANLGVILKERNKVQRLRKVGDRELKKYLVAEIEFSGFENPLLKYVANPVLKLYWRIIKRFI